MNPDLSKIQFFFYLLCDKHNNITPEKINNRKKTFLGTLSLTPSNRLALEFETVIQSNSQRWHKKDVIA